MAGQVDSVVGDDTGSRHVPATIRRVGEELRPDAITPTASLGPASNVLTVREMFASIDAAFRLAQALAMGCGLPKNDQTQMVTLAKMVAGAELGLAPMAAVRSFHFIAIPGRDPVMSPNAHLLVALIHQRGWDTIVEESEPRGEWCKITAVPRPGTSVEGRTPQTVRYTIEDAEKAGLLEIRQGKKPGAWHTVRPDMLYARAASIISRRVEPSAISGLYSVEEMVDAGGHEAKPHEVPASQLPITSQIDAAKASAEEMARIEEGAQKSNGAEAASEGVTEPSQWEKLVIAAAEKGDMDTQAARELLDGEADMRWSKDITQLSTLQLTDLEQALVEGKIGLFSV